jgi:hypothetical protein
VTELIDASSRAEASMMAGFATLDGPFATPQAAFGSAGVLLREIPVTPRFSRLEVIGDFVIPPSPDHRAATFRPCISTSACH